MHIAAATTLKKFFWMLIISSTGLAAQARCAQTMEIADLQRIADLSAPVAASQGHRIAYTVTQPDPTINKSISHIWLISADGRQQKQLTTPAGSNAWQAQFSSDGTRVNYLSDRGADHSTQVWMQPVDADDAQQLTHLEGGVLDYSLAPDGHHLAVVSEIPNGETEDGPIVIDRYQFKDDERGYLTRKRRALFSISLDDQSVLPLSNTAIDVWLPAWSPDGKSIVYVSKREHEGDRHTGFNLYLISATGGTPRLISRDGYINNDPDHLSRPAWSPDSTQIAYLQGGPEKQLEYAPWELATVNLQSGAIKKIGKPDRNYTHPQFSADGRALYAIIEESRTAYLTRIDLHSGKAQNLTSGQRMDVDFSVDATDHVALLTCDALHPCRLTSVVADSENLLADHNPWLADYMLAPSEDIQFNSKDGTLVQALLVRPLGYQPGQRYPTIVRLHGGPQYQFSHEFMLDWQVYAAHGYAVLAVNPRGSTGRGFEYCNAIWADWGNKDVQDVLAATNYVIKTGIADKNRLGVGGWSYGGMLTDYVIASDTRFKAAIAGAGTGNILTNYGSDEYAVFLEYELGTPWKNRDAYLKVSYPFFHNERIVTPTLFFCSALDFNVPCAGSEQMYQALSSRRVPTQLVIYRDQHHEPDVPSNLTDRLTRYLNWYDRYLKQQ